MRIHKLNCEACGAPILVPDDVDHINCAACGSYLVVERDEGHYVLREVKKVTDAIEKTGQVTSYELRMMTMSQDLSMVEMQLNNLRGEIRSLERAQNSEKPDRKINQQLNDLRYQEFQFLQRMQELHTKIAELSVPDFDNDIQVLTKHLLLTIEMLQVLKRILWRPGVFDKITNLQNEERLYKQKIFQLKIKKKKEYLSSFKLDKNIPDNLQTVRDGYQIITKNIHQMEAAPKTPENKAVLSELCEMKQEYYAKWSQLEEERIQSVLQSGDITSPKGLDIRRIEDYLAKIQHDIRFLEGSEKNHISEEYLDKLSRQERSFKKELAKLRRKSQQGENKILASLGIGTVLAGFYASVTNTLNPKRYLQQMSSRNSEKKISLQSNADSSLADVKGVNPEGSFNTNITPLYDPPEQVIKRILVGLVYLILSVIGSTFLYLLILIFFLDQGTGTTNIQVIGFIFFAFVGFCLGTMIFYRQIDKGNVKPSTIAGIKGISVFLGTALLFLLISFVLDEFSPDASTGIFMFGLCVSPLAGLIFFMLQIRKI